MPLCRPGRDQQPNRLPAFTRLSAGTLRRLVFALLVVGLACAAAQPASSVEVGVIASRTSPDAGVTAAGSAQWLLATRWSQELRSRGGIFGVPVNVELRDDAGVAANARRLAEELVENDVLVIVCCTTEAASQAVAEVAEAAGVPHLSPTTLEAAAAYPYWAYSLFPDDTDAVAAIVADAYREGRPALALMALEGQVGDDAVADLLPLMALVGTTLTHEVRYRPGVQELRPDALMVASTQPGGVVVWGGADDLEVAYEALRRRGYEGNVYGRTALLQPGRQPLTWPRLLNARFALPPALVPPASAEPMVDPSEPRPGTGGTAGACSAAGFRDAQRLEAVPGASANAVAAAPLLAALDIVAEGLEQLIALQIPSAEPSMLRQALRDAMVGRPALCTGAGLIDLKDGQVNAVEPGGLAIGVATNSGLGPVR